MTLQKSGFIFRVNYELLFVLLCFFYAKKSIFFTALTLLTALAALTLLINDTTTFATHNTHVAIPALLTTRISHDYTKGE